MKHKLITIAILSMTLLLAACSQSAPKLTDTGNDAFTQQAYDDALQAYNQAQVKSPELAEPYYNAANTLYRQGNYEEALKQLDKALQVGQSDALAENAHFNAGNAAYNGENWEAAVADYTAALLRNPNDQDAKVNLELALQKQQEQQQQDQQNQDQQDQQNQDQQDQQDQQNQDQQNQDQQNQDQQDQQNQDQQNQDQQGQENQDQQGQQDQQNQDGQPQDQQGQDQQNQDQQSQGQQDQQDQQGQQQDGQGAGQQPSDEQPREGMQLAPGQRMTEDQARQLLAAIARNSDTLQQRLGQFLRVSGRPPVQDW